MIARAWANDIYHIQVIGKGWEANDSQTEFCFPQPSSGLSGNQTSLRFGKDGAVQLREQKIHHLDDGTVINHQNPDETALASGQEQTPIMKIS